MKRQFFSLCAGVVGCALLLQFPATAIAKSKETILYSFAGPPDGAFPWAGLIDVKGTLYGTTLEGGASSYYGTVFSVNPGTGAETVVYSFLAGTDGEQPQAGLIDVKDTLYGTTVLGGNPSCSGGYGCGTVFSVNPKTGAETVVYSFCSQHNCTDGDGPLASLIDVKGTLYGTTYDGGTGCGNMGGCGTVFSVNPNTGAETVIYSFIGGTDGANPEAGMIDVKGTLYGTTYGGGPYGQNGTVFSVNPKTGAEAVVYSFCRQKNCTDGAGPAASLINVKGTLYGTTEGGGGGGTVFSVNPNTGAETVVYSFCSQEKCADGRQPEASLIDVNGALYGTSVEGGTYGSGTVFSVDPKTGAETVVYSFCSQQNCNDGVGLWASLIDMKGALYGTTFGGGTYGDGTVFALKKP